MVLKYHGKLDFTKLEYSKSGKSLYISKTVVDCNIVYENLLFGYFRQKNGRIPSDFSINHEYLGF